MHDSDACGCKRFLVTGATGFVGTHLCHELVAAGHAVTAAVRVGSNCLRLPRMVRIADVGDISSGTDWRPVFNARKFDFVVHLAARVHVLREHAHDPLREFNETNLHGTERLARAAASHGSRFVFASSVHAMCRLSETPLDENSPCNPDSPYGQSKLAAEERIRELASQVGLDAVIVRPPPVYGPGHLGNLMRLMKLAQLGVPLPLGSVPGRRSLIYVGNLTSALAACSLHPAASGECFLVSDGDDVTITDLLVLLSRASDARVRLWPLPGRLLRVAGSLTGRRAQVERLLGSLLVDASKIRRQLNWQPPYTLEQGLRLTAGLREQAA